MEAELPIEFLYEDTDFILEELPEIIGWIQQVVTAHQYQLENLTFVFCSDPYLHQINVEFLNHDTLTDIITFDNADDSDVIEGDVFISVDRVRENAGVFNVSFRDELHRVIIHGVLHLLGYKDKELLSRTTMRHREDTFLSLRSF